ncbi:MAG TPA: DUF4446 family protein [Alphaproteobacteria bacterium]|jgi:hypothetical protein|nr:DUF4446 family protein [Alphaproteobacteria bacterium]
MQTFALLILISFGIWLLVLSVVLYRLFTLFSKLTKGVEEDLTKKGFGEVRKRLDAIESDSKKHIQKVGLVRFNPFRELGGDHSFSLAILDREDSGIIITSLHTRDRTRVYMKDIKKGESGSELSFEEKKALVQAK